MKIIDNSIRWTFAFLMVVFVMSCSFADQGKSKSKEQTSGSIANDVVVGAQRLALYHPLLDGKSVGLVVNQTSMVDDTHIVDTLRTLGVDVKKIFAPEHGFRGEADRGKLLKDGKDSKTGLPIISLYGSNKKPSPEQLSGLDVVVFDIQDVGVRFYTYIYTMHYVMEACAELGIPVIVLDRPNPNGHYVDGPVMEDKFTSFIGMHPTPIVYGMTIGEYARMINGEKWLKGGVVCDLTVVECKKYTHDTFYELPVKPSPNLPNLRSILLYPSLCLFEGTTVSVGRGTDKQFQIYGHPDNEYGNYVFTPVPKPGASNPLHKSVECRGYSLEKATLGSLIDRKQLDFSYLVSMYKHLQEAEKPFFNDNNFFEKLAGTESLRKQIIEGVPMEEIRASWQPKLEEFKKVRAKYLIYS